MTETTKFERVDEDTYTVIVKGERLGRVAKAWSRSGGWGWLALPGYGSYETHQTYKTRNEAAKRLTQRVSK